MFEGVANETLRVVERLSESFLRRLVEERFPVSRANLDIEFARSLFSELSPTILRLQLAAEDLSDMTSLKRIASVSSGISTSGGPPLVDWGRSN